MGEETKLRSSVSRAYYAAFCIARNYLRDIKGQPVSPGVEAHTYVRDEFRRSPHRLFRKIGNNLDRLRRYRNKVDYDDSVTGLPSMVVMALMLAQQVISTLDVV